MLACWPPPMCSGGRSPAISVDFGSLWVATQSSWPAAGVLRHDTHIFLWMATLIVRRLSYRIRIFISENNDHTIIHFGKFVSYVFSEMLILRGKVVCFISENSYRYVFSEIRMIRIFIFKIRIDTHFRENSHRYVFSLLKFVSIRIFMPTPFQPPWEFSWFLHLARSQH